MKVKINHTVDHLETVTVDLFGMYRGEYQSHGNQILIPGEGQSVEYDEDDSPHDTLIAWKKGNGKSRNRPGNETRPIHTVQSLANMDNQEREESGFPTMVANNVRCFRRGKAGHVLKDCPVPLQRALSFAPKRGKRRNGARLYWILLKRSWACVSTKGGC